MIRVTRDVMAPALATWEESEAWCSPSTPGLREALRVQAIVEAAVPAIAEQVATQVDGILDTARDIDPAALATLRARLREAITGGAHT